MLSLTKNCPRTLQDSNLHPMSWREMPGHEGCHTDKTICTGCMHPFRDVNPSLPLFIRRQPIPHFGERGLSGRSRIRPAPRGYGLGPCAHTPRPPSIITTPQHTHTHYSAHKPTCNTNAAPIHKNSQKKSK